MDYSDNTIHNYLKMGLDILPVFRNRKHCMVKAWNSKSFTEKDFINRKNVSLRLNKEYDYGQYIICIDFDIYDKMILNTMLNSLIKLIGLPKKDLVIEKTASGKYHIFLKTDRLFLTKKLPIIHKYQNIKDQTIEILAKNKQVCITPSIVNNNKYELIQGDFENIPFVKSEIIDNLINTLQNKKIEHKSFNDLLKEHHISLIDILEKLNLKYKDHNDYLTLTPCPFHNDSKNSFTIYKNQGYNAYFFDYHDNQHYNIFSFIKTILKSDNKEVFNWLNNTFNIKTISKKELNISTTDNSNLSKLNLPFCFWYESAYSNGITKLNINHNNLIDFISSLGICKIQTDTNNHLDRVLVQIKNNIINPIDIAYIQNLVRRYLDKLPENISPNYTKDDLIDLFSKGINNYIQESKINLISFKEIELKRDTKEKAFFYFKNKYLEITKDKYTLKDYKDLEGYIWKSQILDHDISIIDDLEKIDNFSFSQFCKNICTSKELNRFDNERYKALQSAMGYLLYNYKTSANNVAVVLMENNITNAPTGGTGKGIIVQAISKLRSRAIINGKNFNTKDRFAYQDVNRDTQVLFFDDVPKNFNFENLFSLITEGINVEKKFKDSFHLPIEKSPKLVISTNYAIKGNSVSDNRRKKEIELYTYYNDKFTPEDDFNEIFFSDWDKDQWNIFYNFMFNCVSLYFNNNKEIYNYHSETMIQKKMYLELSEDFVEFANTLEPDTNLICNEVYNDYLSKTELNPKNITKGSFSKKLNLYCNYKNYLFIKKQAKINNKNQKVYIIQSY